MGIKTTVLLASALVLSTNLNAAIIDNGVYTTDTVSGLDWLDLTEATNRSYNDISSQLGLGGEFEGWRYASGNEVSGFLDAFGGDSDYYSGWSTQNNGLFDAVASLWGDTYCAFNGCSFGDGYSLAITSDVAKLDYHYEVRLYDYSTYLFSATNDDINIGSFWQWDYSRHYSYGSALVREASVVPVPAAIWLFGSGLLGLIGLAKRKKV